MDLWLIHLNWRESHLRRAPGADSIGAKIDLAFQYMFALGIRVAADFRNNDTPKDWRVQWAPVVCRAGSTENSGSRSV